MVGIGRDRRGQEGTGGDRRGQEGRGGKEAVWKRKRREEGKGGGS